VSRAAGIAGGRIARRTLRFLYTVLRIVIA
jgi:hypothetical protein